MDNVSFVIEIVWGFIIKPYRLRKHFQQYGGKVTMTPRFNPPSGDFQPMQDLYIAHDKYIGDYMLDEFNKGREKGSAAYTYLHIGQMTGLWVNDVTIQEEMVAMVPEKIDRWAVDGTGHD